MTATDSLLAETTAASPPTADAVAGPDAALEYRSLPTIAVLGLLLGVASAVVLFTAGSSLESTIALTPIPLVALFVSVAAWRKIDAAPDLYTGKRFAQIGTGLAALFLVTGVSYASFVHATEVPEGYERVSFLGMKPTELDNIDRKLVPDPIVELIRDGEKVFIKGYIRPDSVSFTQNISKFLLVRDNNECCFGDLSKVKYFDQIQVQLGTGLTTDFSRGVFRLGGVLRTGPGQGQLGAPLTYYLDADYVKP